MRTCPVLRPRRDLGVMPSCAKILPSAVSTASAPATVLSWLNHTACTLPVYASRSGFSLPAQHSVPAVGTLGRAGSTPRRVPTKISGRLLPPFPISQAWPGAPKPNAPDRFEGTPLFHSFIVPGRTWPLGGNGHKALCYCRSRASPRGRETALPNLKCLPKPLCVYT